MNLASTLPMLLGLAWLLPLVSFALIVFFGPRMGQHGRRAATVATAAIIGGFVLSLDGADRVGSPIRRRARPESQAAEAEAHRAHRRPRKRGRRRRKTMCRPKKRTSKRQPGIGPKADRPSRRSVEQERQAVPRTFSGDWYTLAHFGSLRLTIGYYIDALTVVMFAWSRSSPRASTSTPSATCTKNCTK